MVLDLENVREIRNNGNNLIADGKRLGRGKGYYDTYLSKCSSVEGGCLPGPKTIALAFRQQIVQDVPIDQHDVMIQKVLFDDGS